MELIPGDKVQYNGQTYEVIQVMMQNVFIEDEISAAAIPKQEITLVEQAKEPRVGHEKSYSNIYSIKREGDVVLLSIGDQEMRLTTDLVKYPEDLIYTLRKALEDAHDYQYQKQVIEERRSHDEA